MKHSVPHASVCAPLALTNVARVSVARRKKTDVTVLMFVLLRLPRSVSQELSSRRRQLLFYSYFCSGTFY